MRKHFPFIVFYFLLLITGICIHGDYGVSWDEAECRIDNGILNTNYIRTLDKKPLLESISHYHGAAYEMFLVTIENVGGFKSSNEIFLMRHLVTFFVFTLSVFFFYLLCLRTFKSSWYALTACLFLVLCPRIFADSFYNSKDLPFFSLVIIDFYLIVKFIDKKTIRNAILCAVVAGMMIDVRVMGVILPMFTFFYLLIDFIRFKEQRKKIILSSFVFLAFLIGVIILFWPILWLGPVEHFLNAWREMSMYPWDGKVLYRGSLYMAADLPWHYLPVWMLITIPPLYTALLIIGFFILLKKFIVNRALTVTESFSIILFVFPLLSVLILRSVVYDGWRHLFFIYPGMVIIMVLGLQSLLNLIDGKFRNYFIALVAAYFSSIIITMAELHPFENVYFNSFAGEKINENYEKEYWALSYKQGFEYIMNTDSSDDIVVYLAEPAPGSDNLFFLPRKYRSRITVTDVPELADYYLTCHRYDRSFKNYSKVHRITRDGIIIHSIYDLRYNKIALGKANQIAEYTNDYEIVPEQFHPLSVVADQDKITNHAELIRHDAGFGGNFNIHPPESITKNVSGKKYMIATMKLRSAQPFRAMIVFQVDSTRTYQWFYNVINNSFVNEWNTYKYICALPEIYSTSDVLKVHLQNYEKGEFELDDFNIRFFSVDTAEVSNVRKLQPL